MAWFWTIIQLLIRLSASLWSCGMKMLHGIWYKLEHWIKRYLIQTDHRLFQKYFKSYRIALRVAWFWTIIQLLIRLSASFWSYDMKMFHGIWYKLGHWIKRYLIWTYHRIISRVFQVIYNSFKFGFMAWFWTIIQLLIHFTVSLSSCDIKMLHGIWYKVGGLNQQISYSNLPQVISKVFQVI